VRTLGLSVDRLLCVGLPWFTSSLVASQLVRCPRACPSLTLPYSEVFDMFANPFFVRWHLVSN
jgi:hypothetical protein